MSSKHTVGERLKGTGTIPGPKMVAKILTRTSTPLDSKNSFEESLCPIRSSIDNIRLTVESHTNSLIDTGTTLSDHSDRITTLESKLAEVMKENESLRFKVDDLENSHIPVLPKGTKGQTPTRKRWWARRSSPNPRS